MKILDISVERFGAWEHLNLGDLSPHVTLFYGRNEAGKTTLMQFVRAMLFGASETGRRYLPRDGGIVTGSLSIESEAGQYAVARTLSARHLGTPARDELVVTGSEGSRHGNHALEIVLSGIDESVYRNVYAIGLREIQELGALSDTEAARHLYDLSAGLDRVSLGDVLRQLKTSREQLLAPDDRPSEIIDLVQRRDALRQLRGERRDALLRYRDLLTERTRLTQQVAKLEKQQKEVEHQSRLTELAFSLKEKWTERRQVRQDLEDLGAVTEVSREDVASIGRIAKQLRDLQGQQSEFKEQRQRLRGQLDALPGHRALTRQGPRIEALAEQRTWIRSLEAQVQRLGDEVAQLEAEQAAIRRRMGLDASADGIDATQVQRSIAELRVPARDVKSAKKRLQEHRKQASQRRDSREAADVEISSALAVRGDRDLTSALTAAHERTATLRDRIASDERLEQIDEAEKDLQQRQQDLLGRQILPPWTLAVTGAVFALGVMLLLAGLLMPTSVVGSFGWFLAILGIVASGAAIGTKFAIERSARRELAECERHLEAFAKEKQHGLEDRDALDTILPSGGGPLAVQLRRAEAELAGLEQLASLETEAGATPETETGRLLAGDVERAYEKAKRAWREALQCVDLPHDLSPRQVRELASGSGELATCERRLAQRTESLEHRREELAACTARIVDIAEQAELELPKRSDLDARLEMLEHAWTQHKSRTVCRDELQVEIRDTRRQYLGVVRQIAQRQAKRRIRLEELGAENASDLREMADRYARFLQLNQRQAQLDAEITTARGEVCLEEDLEMQLSGTTTAKMERRWDNLTTKLQKTTDQLREHFEKKGQIVQQIRTLAEDRRAARTELELNCVEQRLSDAITRWRALAVTALLLDSLRNRYEQERQPATLREASQYLEQLTEGRYRRVWTPLDEDSLKVDTSDGATRTLDALSRGTREQLFLSLRLALVALYAQRGIRLPLVLDDVLVNFDRNRASAAAGVLSEFARRGHQLLIFTCHEHLLDIFESHGADIRRLPSRDHFEAIAPAPPRAITSERVPVAPPMVVASPDPRFVVEDPPTVVRTRPLPEEGPPLPTINEMPQRDDEIAYVDWPTIAVEKEPRSVAGADALQAEEGEETWETDEDEAPRIASVPRDTQESAEIDDRCAYGYSETEYSEAEEADRDQAYGTDINTSRLCNGGLEDAA